MYLFNFYYILNKHSKHYLFIQKVVLKCPIMRYSPLKFKEVSMSPICITYCCFYTKCYILNIARFTQHNLQIVLFILNLIVYIEFNRLY